MDSLEGFLRAARVPFSRLTAANTACICPRCSHTRKKKFDKCCDVRLNDTGELVLWNCKHCDQKGYFPVGAGTNGRRPATEQWQPMVPPPDDAPDPTEAQLNNAIHCDRLFEYRNQAARLCYVIRQDQPEKSFRPLTYGTLTDKSGHSVTGWHPRSPKSPTPLYSLDLWFELQPATAVLVEGEAAADAFNSKAAAEQLPYVALSWMGGAQRADRCDLAALQGQPVVIWPDADPPGAKAGAILLERAKPIAKTVALIRTEGLPPGYDAADLEGPLGPFLAQRLVDTPKLPWFRAGDDWDEIAPPQQEWTVYERFPKRQVVLLSGEGSAGKSTIALHLCAAHALERDWLQALIEPGGAFFIDAEDDIGVIHRRLDAVRVYYKATFKAMFAGGLKIMPMVGEDVLMATVGRKKVLEPTTFFKLLLEEAGDLKPRTIAIASVANVFGGVENDRAQVTQFIGMLSKLAIAANGSVLLIAHPSLTGINTGSGISGSTAWHSAVRARAYLTGVKGHNGDEPDGDLRQLEFKKNQYGRVSAKLVLRWRDGMFLPETTSSIDNLARASRAEEVLLTVTRRLDGEDRPVSPNPSARNYAPRVISDEPEAKDAKLGRGDLEDAMRRLFRVGKIRVVPYGAPSRGFTKITT